MEEITPKEYMESFLHFKDFKIIYEDSYKDDFYKFNIKILKENGTCVEVPLFGSNAFLIKNTSINTILKDYPYILADAISYTVNFIIDNIKSEQSI